ncbi:hypothetical protein Pmani_033816, partial [Petrolisthes manimaculis]
SSRLEPTSSPCLTPPAFLHYTHTHATTVFTLPSPPIASPSPYRSFLLSSVRSGSTKSFFSITPPSI